jgi:hypothetical protein
MRFRFILIGCLLVTATCSAWAQQDLVNVRDCGAKGDGKADDAQAFFDAVAQGKQAGKHVYVPRGVYRLSRTIELENIGITGPPVGAWSADVDALPQIVPAQATGPVFHMLAGGSLRGLDISYAPGLPEERPPTVLVSGIGVNISNCRIRYPWDAILTDGVNNVGRLNIENVFIVSPLNVGVRVTGTWDVPTLRNIEVWNAGPVPRGLEKGIGFLLGKNDLIRVTDCFAFAMQRGFLIEDKIPGCKIEGGTWGLLTGCGTDFCGYGIEVRGEDTVSIAGGTFWDHAESLVVAGKGARVRVSAAELKSNGAPALSIQGGDQTVIQGCSILRPMEQFKAPAVSFTGGNLVLTGNHIEARGPGIQVGPGAAGGVISNNFITTGAFPAVVQTGAPSKLLRLEGNVEEDAAGK